jgi:hypothetical protein
VKEATKTLDNADAYRGFLTNYFAKISLFKEILPYEAWAKSEGLFDVLKN